MTAVRPAGPESFEEVYPLLREFPGTTLTKERWRRMLFDLPWPVEEKHRGYMLVDGRTVVGFLGTIFSRRFLRGHWHRFCNLSSWIVRESHRAASLELLLPVLALKSHTLVNLSPSLVSLEVCRGLGFRVLENQQFLVPLIGAATGVGGHRGARIIVRPEAIRSLLEGSARHVFDHVSGTRATQLLLKQGDQICHVVATATPWRWRLALAQIQFASNWDLFWSQVPLVNRALFLRLGCVGLRIDGRFATGQRIRFSPRRELFPPTLYRPAFLDISPLDVDGLYSERMG